MHVCSRCQSETDSAGNCLRVLSSEEFVAVVSHSICKNCRDLFLDEAVEKFEVEEASERMRQLMLATARERLSLFARISSRVAL